MLCLWSLNNFIFFLYFQDPAGIFELIEVVGNGTYGQVYKVIKSPTFPPVPEAWFLYQCYSFVLLDKTLHPAQSLFLYTHLLQSPRSFYSLAFVVSKRVETFHCTTKDPDRKSGEDWGVGLTCWLDHIEMRKRRLERERETKFNRPLILWICASCWWGD